MSFTTFCSRGKKKTFRLQSRHLQQQIPFLTVIFGGEKNAFYESCELFHENLWIIL